MKTDPNPTLALLPPLVNPLSVPSSSRALVFAGIQHPSEEISFPCTRRSGGVCRSGGSFAEVIIIRYVVRRVTTAGGEVGLARFGALAPDVVLVLLVKGLTDGVASRG